MLYSNCYDDEIKSEEVKLLNLTYFKLQQVKYNKLSKRPIETPLQQSVIVWNFLKKLEYTRQSAVTATAQTSSTMETVATTTSTPVAIVNSSQDEWLSSSECTNSSLTSVTDVTVDDCEANKENQLMDIDTNYTLSNLNTMKTTPIGSERRTKLLNKIENESKVVLAVVTPPQPQQQPLKQQQNNKKRYKSSMNFYSFYDYYEYDDNEVDNEANDEDDDEYENEMYYRNLLQQTATTSAPSTQQFNLWSNSFNYLNKSCSYEHDQTSSHHQMQSQSANHNIEQVINILIECE